MCKGISFRKFCQSLILGILDFDLADIHQLVDDGVNGKSGGRMNL